MVQLFLSFPTSLLSPVYTFPPVVPRALELAVAPRRDFSRQPHVGSVCQRELSSSGGRSGREGSFCCHVSCLAAAWLAAAQRDTRGAGPGWLRMASLEAMEGPETSGGVSWSSAVEGTYLQRLEVWEAEPATPGGVPRLAAVKPHAPAL